MKVGVDEMGVDEIGVDEMGVDEMGVDVMGVDEMGGNPSFSYWGLIFDQFVQICSKKPEVRIEDLCEVIRDDRS